MQESKSQQEDERNPSSLSSSSPSPDQLHAAMMHLNMLLHAREGAQDSRFEETGEDAKSNAVRVDCDAAAASADDAADLAAAADAAGSHAADAFARSY